jgi:hypothetical protein
MTARRHRLRTLIVFLMLGAAANVAAAWAFELWGESLDVAKGVPFQQVDGVGPWFRPVPDHWPSPTERGVAVLGGRTNVWTTGMLKGRAPQPYEPFYYGQLITQSGWPCRSMESEQRLGQSKMRVDSDYLADAGEVPVWLVPDTHKDRRVPIRPIWPGFAINTLFYSAICWLLVAAPLAVRRRRRIKRGLCPACAYPVGASDVCTECGTPRPVTATRSSAPLAE